jgi:hypothetical protein
MKEFGKKSILYLGREESVRNNTIKVVQGYITKDFKCFTKKFSLVLEM